jgi:hypothetical protein
VHPTLSEGQRKHVKQILVENVAAGMVDLAEQLDRGELEETLIEEAMSIQTRYEQLWEFLHSEPVFGLADRYRVEDTIRRLDELGFAVDEIALRPVTSEPDRLRLHVAVGDRRYNAQRLRDLTGMDVGEGQAGILLGIAHLPGPIDPDDP